MNILSRLDELEQRISMLEAGNTCYKYSRSKVNTINVGEEIQSIKTMIGLDATKDEGTTQDILVYER